MKASEGRAEKPPPPHPLARFVNPQPGPDLAARIQDGDLITNSGVFFRPSKTTCVQLFHNTEMVLHLKSFIRLSYQTPLLASSFPSETCNSCTEGKAPDELQTLKKHFRARARTQAYGSGTSLPFCLEKQTFDPPWRLDQLPAVPGHYRHHFFERKVGITLPLWSFYWLKRCNKRTNVEFKTLALCYNETMRKYYITMHLVVRRKITFVADKIWSSLKEFHSNVSHNF